MLPIRTILHATDFSECSRNAAHLASALARDYNARLIILHAAVPPTIAYSEGAIPLDPDLFVRDAKRQLEEAELPANAERRFEEGDAVETILRVAEETETDLIVLGTHGRTGLERLLMGSVAEYVLRKAPCPVLTVKTPFPEAARAASVRAEEVVTA